MNPKNSRVISFLTTSFPRYEGDSAGNFILKFSLELAKLGTRLEVLTPDAIDAAPLSLPAGIHLIRFKYFIVRSSQNLAYGAGIPSHLKQSWWSLIQLPFLLTSLFFSTLRSARKSALLHAFWFPAGLIAVIVGKMKSKPVVITLWGSDLLYLKIPVFSKVFRMILNKADMIICENQHFKNQLAGLKFFQEKIIVIPNGIDLDQFKPSDKSSARKTLNLSGEGQIILSIGSLIKTKGHIYLVQGLSDLLKEREDIQLHILGNGSEHELLKKEIKRLKLGGKINLTGMVTHRSIPTWLNAADIFVLPSLHEGTPNSLLEAMACGLPVVASTTGGIPEIINDDNNGLLITPACTSEIRIKIKQLVESSESRKRLGRNARLSLESGHDSWEAEAKKLYSVYQNLLNNRHTTHR